MRGKKLVPEGMAVIHLNTDLKKARPFDESKLTQLQAYVFPQLSSTNQEIIREGYGTLIIDLADGTTKCEFNMDGYQPPERAYESMARLQEYYSVEENRRKFDEHMAKKKKDQ